MSDVICFDRIAEAKGILKSGVSSTSVRGRSELKTAAWYLMNKTTYSPKQVMNRLRKASEDYFKGMPDKYIDDSISDIIASVKRENGGSIECGTSYPLVIYKEELERIEEIGHDDTERLAFVFLCVYKMIPYEQVYECNSEIFRLAWRYKYDSTTKTVLHKQIGRRVGGQEPTKRITRLCQSGIVKYFTRINTAYKISKEKPPAATVFSVPILQNEGEAAFIIEKPDKESLVLYYDRYKGYKGIIDCQNCGKPVLRTGRRQKYCPACADIINHHPKKGIYDIQIGV